ncbi:DUF4430 domain-containing protein [Desulfofalx alkaliphila]|uniref:DUF4430 domain-containing protein n=1 Tax=Desulfofalx alkaliphila TaxID=105483 RepID=UPI0004E22B24|nr:DUF4430 domain-containing protein [Desulfofalx alkaliphila]
MRRFALLAIIIALIFTLGCVQRDSPVQENTENSSVENRPITAESSLKESAATEKEDHDERVETAAVKEKEEKLNTAPVEVGIEESATGLKAVLWVTKDFGSEQMVSQEVAVGQNYTVMDILHSNLSIETQYGGGFVASINNLESGYMGADKKKWDWFYYMNGIMTSVGAQDYSPGPREVIWWDYHTWGASYFTPAVIGAFPEPFVSGYQGKNPGTTVLVTDGCEEEGERLAQYLRNSGVKTVEIKPYSEELVAADQRITIVVGLWNQLGQDKQIQGLQKHREKTGLYVKFDPQYFSSLNIYGHEVERYHENTGAIVATGTGMGDVTPLWLVTGLDKRGLEKAVNLLINDAAKIKQHFGAIVTDHGVVAVPVI